MAVLMIPANPLAAKQMTRVRSSASRKDHAIVKEFREGCAAPLPVLRQVAEGIAADMRKGLNGDGGHSLPMIPTFVNTLPSGLKVQLGGKDGRVIDTEFEQVAIPQDLMFGTSEELFDFIASGLGTFVQKESGKFHLPSRRLREIGFTFSFPVKQTSIDSGILIKLTKGFAVSGTVNDTVGTLAGARYWDDDAMVAVILGTGTNACYVERMDCIPKLQGHLPANGDMIINTEWGAFHDSLPLTEFDKALDAASINPGEQILEKTISGMYLGEVARRVFLKMAESGAMFGGSAPDKLSTPFVLRTHHLCAMQQDQSSDLKLVGKILSDTLGVDNCSSSIREMAIDICDAIVKRGGG
ncbi:hypothetical protein AMTR_s00199p00017510 [Amborella trichopoda]|uniref:Phosphotransferase n=1 Tax=Amborella trichopoda TaxID=13333 RepID=U5DE94_AMBTC|nr:hypothetical protein AMTR_s00199p00017510 [Amborella trichopoda]